MDKVFKVLKIEHVAFIGLTADRLLVEWSAQMKQKLGFKT